MADSDTGSSLYSQIKDVIPYVVDAAIGGAVGGPAGAIAGLGGAGQTEFKSQELQEQRATRMNDVLLQVQQRKQAEQDRNQDRQLQLNIEALHQQESARHDKETEVEHKEHDQDWKQQQEQNRLERTTLAQIVHGQTIGDDDYGKLFGDGDDEMKKRFGDVKDPKLRSLVAAQLIKNHAAASDTAVEQALETINAANGGDMSKTLAQYGGWAPNALIRLAHSTQAKQLKTPEQLKKEGEQDAKETANLAKDLKTADATFSKTWKGSKAGEILAGGRAKLAPARAKAIMQNLVGSTWSGTTAKERQSALGTLTKALTAKPDMSYEDLAALLRPKGAPAKAVEKPAAAESTKVDATAPPTKAPVAGAEYGEVDGKRGWYDRKNKKWYPDPATPTRAASL